MKAILKWISIVFVVLGLAFLVGSYLAFVQGVVTQIGILAVVGIICIAIAVILTIFRVIKSKESQKLKK